MLLCAAVFPHPTGSNSLYWNFVCSNTAVSNSIFPELAPLIRSHSNPAFNTNEVSHAG